MKKNRILYALIIVLAIANIFFLVNHFGHSKRKKTKSPGDFVAKELKFDASQMEKFKILNDLHEVEMKSVSQKIKKLKGGLFTKISEDNVPQKTIDSITGLIGDYETQRDVQTYHHFRAIQELCTQEQKEQFNTIVKKALKKAAKRKR